MSLTSYRAAPSRVNQLAGPWGPAKQQKADIAAGL